VITVILWRDVRHNLRGLFSTKLLVNTARFLMDLQPTEYSEMGRTRVPPRLTHQKSASKRATSRKSAPIFLEANCPAHSSRRYQKFMRWRILLRDAASMWLAKKIRGSLALTLGGISISLFRFLGLRREITATRLKAQSALVHFYS
jgi:hypothetical protein